MMLARRVLQGVNQQGPRLTLVAAAGLTLAGCAAMSQRHHADPFPAPMASGVMASNHGAPEPVKRRVYVPDSTPMHSTRRPSRDMNEHLFAEPVRRRSLAPLDAPRLPARELTPDRDVARAAQPVNEPPAYEPEQPLVATAPAVNPGIAEAPALPLPHPGGDFESRLAALAPQPTPETTPEPDPLPMRKPRAAEPPAAKPSPPAPEISITTPALETEAQPLAPKAPTTAETQPAPAIINLPKASEQQAPAPEVAIVPSAENKPRDRAPTAIEQEAPLPDTTAEKTTVERDPPPAAKKPSRSVTVAPALPVSPKPQEETVARASEPTPSAPSQTPEPARKAEPANPVALLSDVQCPQLPAGGPDPDCQLALTRLLLDQTGSWVSRQPTAADYVSGARLVAFAQLRNRLTCQQLETGSEEAQTAIIALRAAIDGETAVGRRTTRLERTRELALEARARIESANETRC